MMKLVVFALLIYSVRTILLRDNLEKLFLGIYKDGVVMTAEPSEAADINIENPIPNGIGSILSLGTKAIMADVKEKDKRKQLKASKINLNDSRQLFKIILVNENVRCKEKRCFDSVGSLAIQHEDKCLGYSTIVPIQNKDRLNVELVDCSDSGNLVTFVISERMDGTPRNKNVKVGEQSSNSQYMYLGFLKKENGYVGHLH